MIQRGSYGFVGSKNLLKPINTFGAMLEIFRKVRIFKERLIIERLRYFQDVNKRAMNVNIYLVVVSMGHFLYA